MSPKPTYEELEQRIQELKRDVVKQKQIEATLKNCEKNFRAFLNSPADISMITDTTGKILYANEFLAERFNRSVDELIGLSVWDLMGETSPIIAESRKAYADEVIKTCKPVRFQDERKGMWFDNIYIPIFDEQEQVSQVACFARDITELKQSEEKFKKMFHLSPSALVTTSLEDGKIISTNASFSRITGYSESEVIGSTTIEVGFWIKPEDCKYVTQKLKKDEAFINLELEYYDKQGEIRLGKFSAGIISIQENQYILTAIEDITEKKRLEEALLQANKGLEEKVNERTVELEEKNITLKVLLGQRGDDKKKLEEAIMSNVKELVLPNLTRLKNSTLSSKQQTALNVLESNLNEIISPFAGNVSSSYLKLTPPEIQVANFIKHGASSKDIADSLALSQRTIDTHRYNIRKKIGIGGKGVNLRTYLSSH